MDWCDTPYSLNVVGRQKKLVLELLVGRETLDHDPLVGGSSPPSTTNIHKQKQCFAPGQRQVVSDQICFCEHVASNRMFRLEG